MKTQNINLLSIALVLITISCFAAIRTNGVVNLQWDYNTNELNKDLTFIIYTRTNLQSGTWKQHTNVIGTNLACTVVITQPQMFFTMTASNYWGESDNSNIISTPNYSRTPAVTIK